MSSFCADVHVETVSHTPDKKLITLMLLGGILHLAHAIDHAARGDPPLSSVIFYGHCSRKCANLFCPIDYSMKYCHTAR